MTSRRALARAGSVAAILAALLTLAWMVVLAVAPTPEAHASAAQRLQFIYDHDTWQIASFLPTLLLAAMYVVIWLGIAAFIWPSRPAAAAISLALGLLYAPFSTWAYWSQLTVVRGLAELYTTAPAQAETLAITWCFDDGHWSVPYAADILGYTLWATAAAAAWIGLRGSPGRLPRLTGLLYGLSSALMILGTVGYLSRNTLLQAGIMLSGMMSLPAVIATAVLLRRTPPTQTDNALDDEAPRPRTPNSAP